jgi:hypothetical protein
VFELGEGFPTPIAMININDIETMSGQHDQGLLV